MPARRAGCLADNGTLLYNLRMTNTKSVDDAAEFFADLANANGFIELFRTLPEVHFYAKNAAGQFMSANTPSLLRNGLVEEQEIIGKTDFDFHPPEMAAGYRAEDQQVMDSKRPLLNQVWLVYDHLNVQQWFVSSKVPLFNRRGETVGIAGAMRSLLASEGMSPYQPFATAINHVLEHYGQALRVPDLAAMSRLSVSQFDRRFRKLFRMSPTQYILRVRVNAARQRLSGTKRTIALIASDCGFYDQAQLARSFKRLTGMTPSAYRRVFETGRGERLPGRSG